MPNESGAWRRLQWFRNEGKLARAAADLRESGQPVTQGAVARLSGLDRATVARHFENPEDAIGFTMPTKAVDHLLACIDARSADEPALCMAVHAVLDSMRAREQDPDDAEYLRHRATFLSSSLEAQLLVGSDYIENFHPLVAQRLAERHDRFAPNLHDTLAADQVICVVVRGLLQWCEEEFKRSYSEIVLELVSYLGHHAVDGSCLFAPPNVDGNR
jgi:hypothetical protein